MHNKFNEQKILIQLFVHLYYLFMFHEQNTKLAKQTIFEKDYDLEGMIRELSTITFQF